MLNILLTGSFFKIRCDTLNRRADCYTYQRKNKAPACPFLTATTQITSFQLSMSDRIELPERHSHPQPITEAKHAHCQFVINVEEKERREWEGERGGSESTLSLLPELVHDSISDRQVIKRTPFTTPRPKLTTCVSECIATTYSILSSAQRVAIWFSQCCRSESCQYSIFKSAIILLHNFYELHRCTVHRSVKA